MACHCPVVASAVGGIPEVVISGETGILIPLEQQKTAPFEPVDADRFSRDLADGINHVVSQPELARKLGEKGRQRVEEHFDWKSIADQTIQLYKKLINNHGQ
jgi:glycosyltransferase involved in cell wall biosynthesis